VNVVARLQGPAHALSLFPLRLLDLKKKTLWPESVSKLYRPSDRLLSAKLVPTFADRGCHVVGVTDSYDRILYFLDRNRYFFFQVASQLHSRGWVDPVPEPVPPTSGGRSVGIVRSRTQTMKFSFLVLDNRGGPPQSNVEINCEKVNLGECIYRSTISWPRHYLEVNGSDLDDMERWKFFTLLGLKHWPLRSASQQPVAMPTELRYANFKSTRHQKA
jgi:hypothetical protein